MATGAKTVKLVGLAIASVCILTTVATSLFYLVLSALTMPTIYAAFWVHRFDLVLLGLVSFGLVLVLALNVVEMAFSTRLYQQATDDK